MKNATKIKISDILAGAHLLAIERLKELNIFIDTETHGVTKSVNGDKIVPLTIIHNQIKLNEIMDNIFSAKLRLYSKVDALSRDALTVTNLGTILNGATAYYDGFIKEINNIQ